MSVIDEIKRLVNCRELAAAYGVRFRGTTAAHCWNADGHKHGDRSASLQVHVDGYKCHGCGAVGDAFDIVQYFEGCGLAEAVQILSERVGVIIPPFANETPQRRNAARSQRPNNPPQPDAPAEIPDIRREILGRIWDVLAFARQPDELFKYGEARGVSEHTMRLTVRDWTSVGERVVQILRDGYSRADLTAAGVLKSDGNPWHPFAEVREIVSGARERAASGFVVPVFDGVDSAPVAYRWRFYRPGKLKALMQPSGSPVLPVGLDSISRARSLGPYAVILCEGETDWLTTIEAARVAGVRAAVLSHCTMSAPWRSEWTALFSDAEAVLVAFDEGSVSEAMPDRPPNGKQRAAEIARHLVGIHGAQWYGKNVRIWLTREGFDLADRHKNGELAPLIHAWTAETMQEPTTTAKE